MNIALTRPLRPASALFILALLALALRLVVVALTNGANFDIESYMIQAQSVLTHHNIYTFTVRYPYPPVWVWVVGLLQWLANTAAISFDRLVRLPGIIGDVCMVALLQRARGNKAALFYAVNPVSLVITAGHGQFDGLVMAFVVATWALWDDPQRRKAAWAALALGGAIALKGYPVLLLPGLLIGAASNKQRVLLVSLACVPLLASILVYSAVFGFEGAMISHVLGYQSPPMFGWSLYVNSLLPHLWPADALQALLLLALVLSVVARVAVLFLPVTLAIRKPTWPLAIQWLTTLLGFYMLAPGLSPQYLLWVLPLLALVDLKKGLFYTFFSTLALVFVYLQGFPEAIPWGPALSAAAPAYIWTLGYWVTNLAWWLACLWLLSTLLCKGTSLSDGSSQKGEKTAKALPAPHLSLVGLTDQEPYKHEMSDRSRPESASQSKTD
jgi:hypothetical protein